MAYAKKSTDALVSQNNTKTSNNNSNNDSNRTAASTTVMFKRVSAPTSESELQNLDLNVVSDVSVIYEQWIDTYIHYIHVTGQLLDSMCCVRYE